MDDGSPLPGEASVAADTAARTAEQARVLQVTGEVPRALRDDFLRMFVSAQRGDASARATLESMRQWRMVPRSIVEFVEDPYFLNLRGEVWPKIMEILEEVTRPGKYVEVVLTGAIGYGKSFAADLLIAYQLYKLSCLWDPQATFRLAAGSSIVIIQQSLTKSLARKVLFEQVARLIRRSPYFKESFPYNTELKTELDFPNGIRLEPIAGNETAAIGENVIAAICDETNFMAVIQKSKRGMPGAEMYDVAMANYNAIARRIKSRFLQQGQVPGQLYLVSSKRHPEDFTERKILEAKTDSTIFVADYAQWETKPAGTYLGPTFRVLVGSASIASRVLAEDEPTPIDADIVEPPIEFRTDFERDPDEALRAIAGRSTAVIHAFLRRRDTLQRAVTIGRRHPFSQAETTLRDGMKMLPLCFDRQVRSPRAVHLDLAVRGDACGIALGYVAGLRQIERTEVEVEQIQRLEQPHRVIEPSVLGDGIPTMVEVLPVVVIEAMLRVIPPPGGEIMLEEVVELLLTMRDDLCLPIRWVTADSFQSVAPLQMLQRRGFLVGTQSVDVDLRPYGELKSALYDGRLQTYEYAPFFEEMRSLEQHQQTGRVDHPRHTIDLQGRRIPGRKDVADAVAGVMFTLMRRRESWSETPATAESGRRDVPRRAGSIR